ncbi:MAG TPA: hypothetical protein VMW52_08955 [Phycisphaerae bacterium]|nr:hypothetical protein [Phycisphaerae bacterium]
MVERVEGEAGPPRPGVTLGLFGLEGAETALVRAIVGQVARLPLPVAAAVLVELARGVLDRTNTRHLSFCGYGPEVLVAAARGGAMQVLAPVVDRLAAWSAAMEKPDQGDGREGETA